MKILVTFKTFRIILESVFEGTCVHEVSHQ